ncbi:MFS transporter [Aureobasidium pullulans]|uniref:MFS transporter n=1 Tax=Aureobasidium pullulans TaxID=5580 RepID=A0AB74JGB4_AURPU|nr:MFS transporter [Aureobasidium pullulans]THX45884.1 MFS transporter [Aureobasidium pullulans]
MNDSKQTTTLDTVDGSLIHSEQTLELGLKSVTESRSEASANLSPEDERSTVAPSHDAPSFVQGSKLAVLVSCTCMAVFLQALDTTIITTAIPSITRRFDSLHDVGWYGSAYFITSCSLQLLWGRLYTFYHFKSTYIAALLTFEVGSALCGAAPSSASLIVGRAIAGVGSAGIFSGSFIVIALSVVPAHRPRYTALVGSMYGVAAVVGPPVGGALTTHATWRWCFLINLPIGALVIFGISCFFKQPTQFVALRLLPWKEKFSRTDYPGSVIFVASMVCLILCFQWAGLIYSWHNARIIVLLFMSGLGIILWCGVQRFRDEKATVPPRIIKMRNMSAAAFSSFCMGSAFFSLLYYVAIYLQAIKGQSALHSGIDSLPMILGLTSGMGSAAFASRYVPTHAPYMLTSAILAAIGCGLISTFGSHTPSSHWIGYQALFGFGQGIGWQRPLLVAQSSLDPKDIPIGTSLMSGAKLLGGAVYVSLSSSIFNNILKQDIGRIAGINQASVLASGATELRTLVPEARLAEVSNAYDSALRPVFYVATGMSCLAMS